ncbi:MAG: type III pantothenate kinase, partial [Mucilaginibacter sp.]|nr:type III pantothenate kinase [Mucilaginibacter sp.]
MANLVIDIGNTLIKIAVFAQDELLYTTSYSSLDADPLFNLTNQYRVNKAIISSVRKEAESWGAALESKVSVQYFNVGMTAGIHNQYKTPHTLGPDRLAAVIGAKKLYPGQGSLVIDAGTTITYDWVDAEGNYFGGSISPGLNMRYKALNYYTGKLPLIDADGQFESYFGDDTESAIKSGVQNGL